MKTKQMRQSAKSYLAIFCFWGMMILVPLYYRYAYFDMLEAKAKALRLVLYVVLAGGVIPTAATVIGRKEKIKWSDRFCSLDYAMCAFAITIFLSWMLCREKAAAFWGELGGVPAHLYCWAVCAAIFYWQEICRKVRICGCRFCLSIL